MASVKIKYFNMYNERSITLIDNKFKHLITLIQAVCAYFKHLKYKYIIKNLSKIV